MNRGITVVITTYNLADMIGKCLEELLCQTFEDFNVLVVDDCSEDSTCSVVKAYEKKFGNRLTVIFCESNNGTPGMVRNIALNSGLISGKYILLLDGDDDIEVNMLERLYNAACAQNSDVVCCGYDRVIASTGSVCSVEMNKFYVKSITPECNTEYIALVNGALWNKLIRTECVKDIHFAPIKIGEDACFQLELFEKAKKIVFIDDILIHYNVYEKSLISNVDIDEVVKLSEKLRDIYAGCGSETYRSAIILSAFIHVGISACVRVYQSKRSNVNSHIAWTKKYLDDNFPKWFKSDCLRMRFLRKLGVKGLAIKTCTFLYRTKMFKLFLVMYTFMINKLGIDIKW